MRERYAVVDVETTGFSPANDRVVEVACALVDGDRVVDRWATLVDPGRAIPEWATAVHGITDDMVAGAPRAEAALRELSDFVGDRTLVAHNARFDLAFLGPLCAEPAICTLRLARELVPEAPNHKNQTLRRHLRIDSLAAEKFDAHRALGDAIVSAHILIACRRRYRRRGAREPWERFVERRCTIWL